MRDDDGVCAELRVAAGVIGVPVRVEDEAEPAGVDFSKRGANLFGERSELVVNNHHAVRPRDNADVPARAFEHVDAAGDLRRLYLDLREVVLRRKMAVAAGVRRRRAEQREQG